MSQTKVDDEPGPMPTDPADDDQWFAAMRCGRCHHLIRSDMVEFADGRFELRGLPNQCPISTCQAGFTAGTDHALEVTMYRRQTPAERTV